MKSTKKEEYRCVKCDRKYRGNKHYCPHCKHFVFGYGNHRW